MTSIRKLTTAEKALEEQFSHVATTLPSANTMSKARQKAINTLVSVGLPSRKIESWHYTDLRTLLKTIPASNGNTLKPIKGFVDGSLVFTASNGQILPAPEVKGFTVKSLKDILKTENVLNKDDAIGLINTAFVTDGWLIDIPAGCDIAQPIELQVLQDNGQGHLASKVTVGAGATCTIIERQFGDDEASLVSVISDIKIGEGATVNWFIIREQGKKAIDFNQINASLDVKSQFNLYFINAGAALTRQEINVVLEGRESDFQLRGINLLSEQSHTDTTMVVSHLDEHSTSTEIVRNVVTGKARGVFQGMIRVAQAAQKTDARMACNSLILSDDASFDAKPELEIFADDVACGHGATVKEIDHDHLFYLKARGIPEIEARGLLVKAFIAELIDELKEEEIQAALASVIETWLSAHL